MFPDLGFWKGPIFRFFFSIKTNLNWALEAVFRCGMVVSVRSWPSGGREMDTIMDAKINFISTKGRVVKRD